MDANEVTELEAGYAPSHRIYELLGMSATLATGAWLAARLLEAPIALWWAPLALIVGMLGADLVSGLVHWGFDTWGGIDTPLVGRLAIRTFRQHHIDPTIMLRHDFVETNGHNFTLALPLTAGGLGLLPARVDEATPATLFIVVAMLCMAVFVALTSQIHKWAHTPRPPRLVALLQRAHLLLPPAHHQVHHGAPHVHNYCITVGWLDGVLGATRALPRAERAISRLTGARPRRAP